LTDRKNENGRSQINHRQANIRRMSQPPGDALDALGVIGQHHHHHGKPPELIDHFQAG